MIVNYEEESVLNQAAEHSFLGRLAKKRWTVLQDAMPDEDLYALLAKGMNSYYFLAKDIDLYYVMSIFAPYSEWRGLVAFIKPQIYHEAFLQVFYLRRDLEANKKRFVHNR